jgi:cbb3-type cytochrome oxidase maturation protein
MSALFLVLPLAVLLSLGAALAFVWATRRGQFDDLETPAVRLLCDDLGERVGSLDGSSATSTGSSCATTTRGASRSQPP